MTASPSILSSAAGISLSAEFQALLTILRSPANGAENLAPAAVDWDAVDQAAFISLMNRHRVGPAVHEALSGYSAGKVPEQIQNAARQTAFQNSRLSLHLCGETIRLTRLLEAEDIPVIHLKGIPLAMKLYGRLGLRHTGDIDALIRPEDAVKADQLLRHDGFERKAPSCGLNNAMWRYSIKNFHHFVYQKAAPRLLTLELHWRLVETIPFDPFDYPNIWKNAAIDNYFNTDMRTLPQAEKILHLCFHGACHSWFRLFWLLDIARLASAPGQTDWENLMTLARESGLERSVGQAFLLARLLLGSPAPPPVLAWAGQNQRIAGQLLQDGISALTAPSSYMGKGFLRRGRLSRLRPGKTYRLSCLLPRLTNFEDWDTISLPDSLFPLYYILHPILWCRRSLKRRLNFSGPA